MRGANTHVLDSCPQSGGNVGQIDHDAAVALPSKSQELVVLGYNHRASLGKVHGETACRKVVSGGL